MRATSESNPNISKLAFLLARAKEQDGGSLVFVKDWPTIISWLSGTLSLVSLAASGLPGPASLIIDKDWDYTLVWSHLRVLSNCYSLMSLEVGSAPLTFGLSRVFPWASASTLGFLLACLVSSLLVFLNTYRNNLQAHGITVVAFHPKVFRVSYFP